MIRIFRISGLVIIVFLVAFSSAALTPSRYVSQDPTSILPIPEILKTLPAVDVRPILSSPTPAKTRTTPVSTVTQAGNSDRIVLLGILIVGIIVIPILLKRKEWRGN